MNVVLGDVIGLDPTLLLGFEDGLNLAETLDYFVELLVRLLLLFVRG